MSATPRTDAILGAITGKLEYHLDGKASADVLVDVWKAMVKHATQLERDLAEANKKIEALSLRCLESKSIASSFSQRSDELETERQRLQFSSTIESMDLRELMMTTHPETPVV